MQLANQDQLAYYLTALARRKKMRPIGTPKWADKILEGDGLAKSIAGFIFNSVRNNRFRFGRSPKRMIFRKGWEAGLPEHISQADFDGLTEEEQSDFRTAFRLSLPDMVLHSIVGNFLHHKLENILSDHCHAYRQRRGQPTAVQAVRKLQAAQDKWVVKFDVESFNETVDHKILRASLAENVYLEMDDEEQRVVAGVVEALFALSAEANNVSGKGLLVGSGLTPPLTNLYLTPLDRFIETTHTPFVRYGDDLVAFCDTEERARSLLDGLRKQVEALRQVPSSSSAFNTTMCWDRGLRLRFNTNLDADAYQHAHQRSLKQKSDIFQPGDPFDFIGFEFAGDRVFIRQETLGKVKSRIAQYTQRSKTKIQGALDKDDHTWGTIRSDEAEEWAVPSVRYVQHAIQRLNTLLGFNRDGFRSGFRGREKYVFTPGYGFPWNVLKCVDYEDVQDQFRILDAYAYGRLQELARGSEAIVVPIDNQARLKKSAFEFPGASGRRDLRAMGLRTFKDVYNHFPKGNNETL